MLRLTVTGLFVIGILVALVLNPMLTYAGSTTHGYYTIYHNQALNPVWITRLDQATALVHTSEYYDPALSLDICLHDGSAYPGMIGKLRGPAFAWGFYDKVVLMGNADCTANTVELNGYRWNLTQLLAHEMIHCYQFKKRGLIRSNPLAGIPDWKWEGYPEYVSRRNGEHQADLWKDITRLLDTEKTDHNGWITFQGSTGTVIPYYKSWLLMRYCMDVKKLSYDQVLGDTTAEEAVNREMMEWYEKQK